MTVPGDAYMRIEWVESRERFVELADAWDRLAGPQRVPFVRHAWFLAWWDAFGGGRRLKICALWQRDELIALFPLCAQGRRLQAIANAHTPLFRPFARDADALAVVVEAAIAEADDGLSAFNVPADDPAITLLVAASRRHDRITLLEPRYTSPLVETKGTFEQYRTKIKRKNRKEWERLRRKLQTDLAAAIVVLCEPSDLPRELARAFEVEASGWKGRRGTAIARSPQAKRFYSDIAYAFAGTDELKLSTIEIDGDVIAFDFALLAGKRIWVLKGGYDERFRRYGPGVVLTFAEIERCFELRLDSLELLGEEAPWKLDFATASRSHFSVHSYPRSASGVMRFAYRRTLRPRLHRIYRQVLPGRTRG